jgi:tetratricopeptide (TPR) repeat protein
MTFKQLIFFAALVLVALASHAVAQQRAIIRFNPQAPFSAVPETEEEQTDFLAMLDQDDPARRNRLIDDLFADYPSSEYMHMFLQARWELQLERGTPAQIIDTATLALEAYDYFMETKLGYLDDPAQVRGYAAAQYRKASQELRYHQSIVDASTELDDIATVAEHTDLGIAAAARVDQWYGQLGGESEEVAGMDADTHADFSENARMYMLNNLRVLYEGAGEADRALEVSERMIEVIPDDVEMLLSTATQLVSQVPDDAAVRRERMERALDYADRAADGIDVFLLRADLSDEQQAGVRAQLYSTMGMASAQLGDWDTSIAAYEAAIDATPMAPNLHYMLGVAGASAQDIDIALPAFARAHFLAPQVAEIRTTLEQLYQAAEGSLDGLDGYIESQGAALGN